MSEIAAPRRMETADRSRRDGFSCGAVELDQWLVNYAWQNQKANNAVTYVMVDQDNDRIVGYYAIAMACVDRVQAPDALQAGRPAQVLCLLLARLAVDSRYQGQGIGFELLRDALLRTVSLAESIGAAAVLVHCLDQIAKEFYLHLDDFQPSPVDDMQLMVPMKALRRLVP